MTIIPAGDRLATLLIITPVDTTLLSVPITHHHTLMLTAVLILQLIRVEAIGIMKMSGRPTQSIEWLFLRRLLVIRDTMPHQQLVTPELRTLHITMDTITILVEIQLFYFIYQLQFRPLVMTIIPADFHLATALIITHLETTLHMGLITHQYM